MSKEDKKSPKEASKIFHGIMKASVKPKETNAMQINERTSGSLTEKIQKIIDAALKEKADVKCDVTIVVKPGQKSGTQVTLTIDSPVNYDEYGF